MPALLLVDMAALGLTVLVSFTLAFTVSGAGFRRRLNHDFSIFAFLATAESGFGLLVRFSLFYGVDNPLLLFQLAAICYFAMCSFLFLFVARYLGFNGTWPVAVADVSLGSIAVLAPFLFTGAFVTRLRLDVAGTTHFDLTTAGILTQAIPALLLCTCLVLFWVRRTRPQEAFIAVSVVLLMAGFGVGVSSSLKAPILSTSMCASVSILGLGIVRRQLFNPLRDLTADLQERAHRQALIANVGQKTTALIGLDDLLTQAVGLISDSFKYSTVAILLIEGDSLVLRASSAPLIQTFAKKFRLKIGEEGICGRVAATGRGLCVPDVEREPRYVSPTEDIHTRSELAVPIRRGAEVIGVLDIQSTQPDAFSAADLAAQQTVADQLSSPIANARLYERLTEELEARERTARFLRMLNDAALAMEQARAPAEIFRIALARLSDLGLSCAVLLANASGRKLALACRSERGGTIGVFPDTPEETGPWLDLARVPALAEALRQQVTVALSLDQGLLDALPELAFLAAPGAPARAVFAPLTAMDELIGVMAVRSSDLAPEDVPLFSAFAHLSAAACRRARLMEDLEGSLEQLQRMQEQLLHAQKMEAVGRLAGGIAHDFNNLLTVISGYTSLLVERVDGNGPALADLAEIRATIKRASGLTSRLLAFGRKQIVQPAMIELNKVVAGSENFLRPLIGEQVELVVKLAPVPVPVHADPFQLEQVIINLAVNARDAMPHGGRLLMETANVDLGPACLKKRCPAAPADLPAGSYAVLCVQDWGVGMSDETQEHLFEPFFTTKENGKGTGLGLSIVYGIITQTGGRVRVESSPGVGSTFMIWIPRAPSGNTAAETARVG